jgi:SSS family solute:Na+ symporter
MSLFAVDKLGVIPALSLAMVIGVGVLATPSYRQRIYSGKDVSSVRRSFVYTGVLYLFFSVLPAIIGMAAWTMNPHLENSNYAFLFATSFLPAMLGLVVLIAGLSATMSSASSDAIAAVAIMMRDVYTLVTGKMPPAHKAITLSLDAGVRHRPGDDLRPDLERYHQLYHQNDLHADVRAVRLFHSGPLLAAL